MLMAHIFVSSLSPTDRKHVKIAHFNHNLRQDSDEDEELVRAFAKEHEVAFVSARWSSPDTSEETARKARHQFLTNTANSRGPDVVEPSAVAPRRLSQATAESETTATRNDGLAERRAEGSDTESSVVPLDSIATAHHLDDLVETIAINLLRGTGWRGLAVLNRSNYIRPLLELEKSEILTLARELDIKWHEDSTNSSPKYLRNRLRGKIAKLPFDTKWRLLQLQRRQVKIKQEIDTLLQEYPADLQRRELYDSAKTDEFDIYIELLRYTLLRQNVRSTHPELQKLLHAIRTYEPQKKFQLTNNKFVLIRKNDFILL